MGEKSFEGANSDADQEEKRGIFTGDFVKTRFSVVFIFLC